MSIAFSQKPPEWKKRTTPKRFANTSSRRAVEAIPSRWRFLAVARQSRPRCKPPAGSCFGWRATPRREGLPERQTLGRRSIFPDRKTQPGRESPGCSGCPGGAAGCSQAADDPIGPPSQQVSRIMPHWRQTSLARISKVSPEQTGQRGLDMGKIRRSKNVLSVAAADFDRLKPVLLQQGQQWPCRTILSLS